MPTLSFNNLVTRVRYRLQDTGSDIFGTSEMEAAVNSAKDDVLSLVRSYTDLYPWTTTSVTFAVGEDSKALPIYFLEPLYVHSTRPGAERPTKHNLIDFRKQDHIVVNDDLWLLRKADGLWYINRRYTTDEITVNIDYVADVEDQTANDDGFTFGPPEAAKLIIIKAVIELLSSRQTRSRSMGAWMNREAKMEEQLRDNLVLEGEKDGPRYVDIPDDFHCQ